MVVSGAGNQNANSRMAHLLMDTTMIRCVGKAIGLCVVTDDGNG
jgi:hypothetical protein